MNFPPNNAFPQTRHAQFYNREWVFKLIFFSSRRDDGRYTVGTRAPARRYPTGGTTTKWKKLGRNTPGRRMNFPPNNAFPQTRHAQFYNREWVFKLIFFSSRRDDGRYTVGTRAVARRYPTKRATTNKRFLGRKMVPSIGIGHKSPR